MRGTLTTLLLAAMLGACAGGPASSSSVSDEAIASREAFDAEGYQLGAGDEVRITVFGEANLTGTYKVDGRGQVSMPLVGQVTARGLTTDEVSEAVAEALRAGYLRDPRVSAEVASYRPYYILGEVGRPGTYPYQNGLTVMNAVATAQGFTYRANERVVYIKRDGEAEERKYDLDSGLPVQPGDTIRVVERFF
jgi:polysaccharide export outer membrane protein